MSSLLLNLEMKVTIRMDTSYNVFTISLGIFNSALEDPPKKHKQTDKKSKWDDEIHKQAQIVIKLVPYAI